MVMLNVPIEIPDEFFQEVAKVALKAADEILQLYKRSYELPEYPNASEVKQVLKIGDKKLQEWIDTGLPYVQWSKKEMKFDRDDIKKHINSMKIGLIE